MGIDLANAYTTLSLSGVGVAAYSARGLRQTLEPIPQAAQLVRTVNGELIDISVPQFRAYRSTLTGNDQKPPTLAGIWPGMQVTMETICEIGVGDGAADRPAVGGSTYTDDDGTTFFRMQLTMRVAGYSLDYDEYGAVCGWSMVFEEVAAPESAP